MALLKFDEIHKLNETYFAKMDLRKEQILERIELADLLTDVFLYLFTYIEGQIAIGLYESEYAKELVMRRYKDELTEYGISLDKYPEIDAYVERIADKLVDSTENIVEDEDDTEEEKKSKDTQDRAISVAENESNTVFSIMEHEDAVRDGKTTKRWITERDDKVRHTHREVDFAEIPIDEPFIVGDSYLMFPRDDSLGANPRELIRCRCSVAYLPINKESAKASIIYLNKMDKLFEYAKRIKPLDGFEDIVVHGNPYGFTFRNADGKEETISAEEFCELIKNNPNYKGGNIRLISCQVGYGDGIVPQYIADKLGVIVLAPTEIVTVFSDGEMIVANSDYDAKMGIETGDWIPFEPSEK